MRRWIVFRGWFVTDTVMTRTRGHAVPLRCRRGSRSVRGGFSIAPSGLPAHEVRYPGFHLTASPRANIHRRFAAEGSLLVDRSCRPRSGGGRRCIWADAGVRPYTPWLPADRSCRPGSGGGRRSIWADAAVRPYTPWLPADRSCRPRSGGGRRSIWADAAVRPYTPWLPADRSCRPGRGSGRRCIWADAGVRPYAPWRVNRLALNRVEKWI